MLEHCLLEVKSSVERAFGLNVCTCTCEFQVSFNNVSIVPSKAFKSNFPQSSIFLCRYKCMCRENPKNDATTNQVFDPLDRFKRDTYLLFTLRRLHTGHQNVAGFSRICPRACKSILFRSFARQEADKEYLLYL